VEYGRFRVGVRFNVRLGLGLGLGLGSCLVLSYFVLPVLSCLAFSDIIKFDIDDGHPEKLRVGVKVRVRVEVRIRTRGRGLGLELG
jgi:hypothetical protein